MRPLPGSPLVYDTRDGDFLGDRAVVPAWLIAQLRALLAGVLAVRSGGAAEPSVAEHVLAHDLATQGRAVLETDACGAGDVGRIEIALAVRSETEVGVAVRDVSWRAALLRDVDEALAYVTHAAEALDWAVGVQDGEGICHFASTRLLELMEKDASCLPAPIAALVDPVSAEVLARELRKRRLGVTTPYRVRLRSGGAVRELVLSPIPLFQGDTFAGSIATLVEQARGEETALALARYREDMRTVMALGNDIVAQLDELTRLEHAVAHEPPGGERPLGRRQGWGGSGRTPSSREQCLALLTPKESEIATRLTAGVRVAGIAAGLGISVSTVRNHLKSIFRKLDVGSQLELVTLLAR